MKESQIREYLNKGYIRALVTFEVVGKPKEHVEKALGEYLKNLKQDNRLVFLNEEIEAAEEVDDGLFSTFCEAELLIKDLETFTWLCFNFSPASIEILDPDSLEIEAREIQNWLNDLLAQLHEVGTNYRSHKAANDHLTFAMNQLIRNAVLLSLRTGEKTVKQLEVDVGITEENLKPFLKHLTEKDKIKKKGSAYALK